MASSMYQSRALTPRLHVETHAHSHFYQPPTTPSAANSLHDSIASASSLDDYIHSARLVASKTSRKRSRTEFAEATTTDTMVTTPLQPHWARRGDTSGTLSPAPFVSTKYRLAGVPATPTSALALSTSLEDVTPDIAFRRGRQYGHDRGHTPSFSQPAKSLQEGNDYFGLPSQPLRASRFEPGASNRWPRLVYTTALAVAGSVWSFCTTPFRGFVAGGGTAYPLDTQPTPGTYPDRESPPFVAQPTTWAEPIQPTTAWFDPLPSPSAATPRSTKRTKVAHGGRNDDVGGWVLVPRGGVNSPSASPAASPSTASAAPMRKPLKFGAKRPFAPGSFGSDRPASAAGLRATVVSAHRSSPRMSYAHREARERLLRASPRGSPAEVTGRRESSGLGDMSKLRKSGSVVQEESPIAKETARYMQKVRRREREEDRELKRFNRRLKDMIREGKEALDAKVEVVGGEESEDDEEMEWL